MLSLAAATSILLAQASAPAPGTSVSELEATVKAIVVGMILGAIPLAVAAINGVLNIIDHFKHKPPLHREYATKQEVRTLDDQLSLQVTKLDVKLDKYHDDSNRHRESVTRQLTTVAAQMGEIWGRLGCGTTPPRRRDRRDED